MGTRKAFDKTYNTPIELVNLLRSRGLIIRNAKDAVWHIQNIGYYRLSAYMYPLLRKPKTEHHYKENTSFDQVMMLYQSIPHHIDFSWITLATDPLRIYFNLCIIKYFVNAISPSNDMTTKLKMLLSAFPEVDSAAMGVPRDWEKEPVWK